MVWRVVGVVATVLLVAMQLVAVVAVMLVVGGVDEMRNHPRNANSRTILSGNRIS